MTLPEFSDPHLLDEYQDNGTTIAVYENQTHRWIQTGNGNIQSAMNKQQPWHPVLPYFPALLSALLFANAPSSCLVAGLGGGELLRYFNHYYPQTQLSAIENNPLMVAIYHEYFNTDTLGFDCYDEDICHPGNYPTGQQHDIVFVDIYGNDHLPPCFYQQQLYERLATYLLEDGILAINLVVKNEHEALELLKLIRLAFNQRTLCLSVGQHLNLVVLAFKKTPANMNLARLESVASALNRKMVIDFNDLVNNIRACNPHDGNDLQIAKAI